MTPINAYVYLVQNLITGEFYHGYRSANIRFNRNPREDFWIHYRTSSKNLRRQIEASPESFRWQIVFEGEPDECYWQEQILIKQHFKTKGSLNRHYAEPGSKQFWKASPGARKGIPKSPAHCEAISRGKLGKPSTINFEGRANIIAATVRANKLRKGIPRSETVKTHLKEIGLSSGATNPMAKTWTVLSSTGEEFTMKGIKPWCKEHGLIQASLRTTLETGKFYKGFKVLAVV